MSDLRRLIGNQRGFTLAELLVASAMIGLVMAGVFVIQRGSQEAYLLGSNRVETQQNARIALELMTRELRSAVSISAIASTTDITFLDQSSQTVRYALNNGTLNRTVAGVTTALIGGVQSLTMTCYSTYDVYNATYTTTTTPAQAKVIKIKIVTQTEESVHTGMPGDQRATMESTIKLRATLS